MTGILIIAHAPLAQALRECALHVFPECAQAVQALDVQPDDAPEKTLAVARAALACLCDPQVLVLTDVCGATPCNVAQKLVSEHACAGQSAVLLAGANLPMLLRTVCYRHETLPQLTQRALDGAAQGIMQIAQTSALPADCPTP